MKKYLFMAICLLSTLGHASLPISQIEALSGSYLEPSGRANANYFSFETIDFGAQANFELTKQAGSLILETPEDSLQIDNIPDFILELSKLDFSNINLNSNARELIFKLESLSGNNADGALNLDDISIACRVDNFVMTMDNFILDTCLNSSSKIKLGKLKLTDKDQETNISNFEIESDNNKMKYQIKYGSITVKGKGETHFENNTVRIKISTAKVGILSVRGRIFRELSSSNQSPNVTINEPWIEINL